MSKVKTDYAALLRQRAAQAREAREESAPISLQEYRARQARQQWAEKRARLPDGPEAA